VDQDVINVLQKGLNFAVTPKSIPTEEFICNIECGISNLGKDEAEVIRQEAAHILRRSKPPKSNITKEERDALKKLKEKDDIVVLKSDKGNNTVIMDKSDYTKKAYEIIHSGNYRRLKKDPTTPIVKRINGLLAKLEIDKSTLYSVKVSCPQIPKFYGLPKIHKPNVPLRPIVSTRFSPTYNLAKYLSELLAKHWTRGSSYVRNSIHLVERLNGLQLTDRDRLASFDVVSLFTNVPVKDTMDIIRRRFQFQEATYELIELCLTTTYFKFNDEIFEQTDGIAMGSPLSPIIAEIFMDEVETGILQKTTRKPKIWLRYVDDVLLIWEHGEEALNTFLRLANNEHANVKFTLEVEEKSSLPFLDKLIIREGSKLGFKMYRKPTCSDRYIDASSHHHPAQLNGVIKNLFHRILSTTDEKYIQEDTDKLTGIFVKNNFKRGTINRCLNTLRTHKHTQSPRKKFDFRISIPYVKGTTEAIARLLNKNNIGVAYKPTRKIGNWAKSVKDKINPHEGPGVYKVTCECGDVYIGQTRRSINTRIKEHKSCLTKLDSVKSAVAKHSIEEDHKIQWGEVDVLHRERNYTKRIILEAIEVRRNNKNFNREDGFQLSKAWKTLIRNNTSPRVTHIGKSVEDNNQALVFPGQRSRPYLPRATKNPTPI
jgi:hypothetical protein